MANIVTNSTELKAVRGTSVSFLEIIQGGESTFSLNIYIEGRPHAEVFETDTTLEGIQAKAATVIAALEV